MFVDYYNPTFEDLVQKMVKFRGKDMEVNILDTLAQVCSPFLFKFSNINANVNSVDYRMNSQSLIQSIVSTLTDMFLFIQLHQESRLRLGNN